MLFGEYKHTLDAKNRIIVPAKLREILGERFIISKSMFGFPCLMICSMEYFTRIKENIDKIPITESLKLNRFLFRSILVADPDSQGRVTMSAELCSHASFERVDSGIITVGCGDYGEIWSEKLLGEHTSSEDPDEYLKVFKKYGM